MACFSLFAESIEFSHRCSPFLLLLNRKNLINFIHRRIYAKLSFWLQLMDVLWRNAFLSCRLLIHWVVQWHLRRLVHPSWAVDFWTHQCLISVFIVHHSQIVFTCRWNRGECAFVVWRHWDTGNFIILCFVHWWRVPVDGFNLVTKSTLLGAETWIIWWFLDFFDCLAVLRSHLSAQVWTESLTDELLILVRWDDLFLENLIFLNKFWIFSWVICEFFIIRFPLLKLSFFKVFEKFFSLTLLLVSMITELNCRRFIMNWLNVFNVITCDIKCNILHFVPFKLNVFWWLKLFMHEIPTIWLYLFNVWKWNSLFFFSVRILRLVNSWLNVVFLEMTWLTEIKLILEVMIHQFFVERMLTNHVAVSKTVTDGFRNWCFGRWFSFSKWILMLLAVIMSIRLIGKSVTVEIKRRFLRILLMIISFGWRITSFPILRLILIDTLTRMETCRSFSLAFGLLNSRNVIFDHVSHLLFTPLIAYVTLWLSTLVQFMLSLIVIATWNQHFFRNFFLRWVFFRFVIAHFSFHYNLLGHFFNVFVNVLQSIWNYFLKLFFFHWFLCLHAKLCDLFTFQSFKFLLKLFVILILNTGEMTFWPQLFWYQKFLWSHWFILLVLGLWF